MKKIFLLFVSFIYFSNSNAQLRMFSRTHSSDALQKSEVEIALWTTLQNGRKEYFHKLSERLQGQVGITSRLMADVQFIFSQQTAQVDDPVEGTLLETSSTFSSIAGLKFKITDASKFIGSAVMAEGYYNSKNWKAGGRVIVDKQLKKHLISFNAGLFYNVQYELSTALTDDHSHDRLAPDYSVAHAGVDHTAIVTTENDIETELHFAYAYVTKGGLAIGAESRMHRNYDSKEKDHAALFAGPTVAYRNARWSISLNVSPQLVDLMDADKSDDSKLELRHHEKFEGRILIGFKI